MYVMLKLVWILAAVSCTVLLHAPSASAHEGHSHHASVASKSIASTASANERGSRAIAVAVSVAQDLTVGNSRTNCRSNCCGGASGMACCGAAMVPDLSRDLFVESSTRLYISPPPRLPGVPSEAPPKPPKSLA